MRRIRDQRQNICDSRDEEQEKRDLADLQQLRKSLADSSKKTETQGHVSPSCQRSSRSRLNIDDICSNVASLTAATRPHLSVHSTQEYGTHHLCADATPHKPALEKSLKDKGLRLNIDICSICAESSGDSDLRRCTLFTDNGCITCTHSGAQMCQVGEGERGVPTSSESYDALSSQKEGIEEKTALDTIATRKTYSGTKCGYCGVIGTEQQGHHELVDPGQIVRAMFYASDLSKDGAENWIKLVKLAHNTKTRLPMRCCTLCMHNDLALRQTSFAAYAMLRGVVQRKRQIKREQDSTQKFTMGQLTFDEYSERVDKASCDEAQRKSVFRRRELQAQEISDYYAECTRQTSWAWEDYYDDYDDDDDDGGDNERLLWEPKEQEQMVNKKTFYLPPHLTQIAKDPFKVFAREFHSCLLNSAVALGLLVEKMILTADEAKSVMTAIFNSSRWRLEREAGIKVQLVARVGAMSGSPLKSMLENGNSAGKNELGVFVQAFVEQHLHSVLMPVVEGSKSAYNVNREFDQMSGFAIGNQSLDALVIALCWQWRNEGFKSRGKDGRNVPVLTRSNAQESKDFYDFDKWVRELRAAEKKTSNRPMATHDLWRLEMDDENVTKSRIPSEFFKLDGMLHYEKDTLTYKSEPFCVMVPDDEKKANKTHRYNKVEEICAVRGKLAVEAAVDLCWLAGVGKEYMTSLFEASTFLFLKPFSKGRPSGLRDANYCMNIAKAVDDGRIDAPAALRLQQKQKVAGEKPTSISTSAASLPVGAATKKRQLEAKICEDLRLLAMPPPAEKKRPRNEVLLLENTILTSAANFPPDSDDKKKQRKDAGSSSSSGKKREDKKQRPEKKKKDNKAKSKVSEMIKDEATFFYDSDIY